MTSDFSVADADLASPADRRWSACLDGDDADLAELARLMTAPELNVVEVDGAFALESTGFEHLEEPGHVLDAAQPLLGVIGGAARLHTPLLRPLIASVVVDHRGPTPVTHKFVFPGSARARSRAMAPIEPTDPQIRLSAEVALDDTGVAIALTLFGQESTWVSLYQVLDVLRESVGGKRALDRKGWVATAEINRFTCTANNYRALGPTARHARRDWLPPAEPMTLDEAEGLIGRLLLGWLVEKRQTRP